MSQSVVSYSTRCTQTHYTSLNDYMVTEQLIHSMSKLVIAKVCVCMCVFRASGNGLAAPVLAGPAFLKVKMKFNFYKKQVISKSASVIFRLVRLIILNYNK